MDPQPSADSESGRIYTMVIRHDDPNRQKFKEAAEKKKRVMFWPKDDAADKIVGVVIELIVYIYGGDFSDEDIDTVYRERDRVPYTRCLVVKYDDLEAEVRADLRLGGEEAGRSLPCLLHFHWKVSF